MEMNWFDIFIRVCCFVAAIIFILRYLKIDWEMSDEGRHLMAMTATIAGLLGLVLSFAFFGPGNWYIWVSRLFFVALFILLLDRNRLLTKRQNELKKERDRQNNPENVTISVDQTKDKETTNG